MPIYTKQNRILQNKVRHSLYPIDKNIITNHINISTTNKLINKTPSDRLVYSSQNPYGGVGDAGIWVRNPNCWLNGVNNISCFSPAQRSGANWWQRGGTLITPKHALFAAHFATSVLPNGGTPLIFVDENNNAIKRNIMGYGLDGSDIAIAVLDSPVPSNIKIAKVLPPNFTDYISTSRNNNDNIDFDPKLYAIGLDQEEKAILKIWSSVYRYTTNIITYGSTLMARTIELSDMNPSNYSTMNPPPTNFSNFFETIITGDSGNPLFIIVDNELVVLTTWWGPNTGPFTTGNYDRINGIIENLSPGEGYNLTPVDLELVYHKYS